MSRSNPAFDVLITDDITLRSAVKANLFEEVSGTDVPNIGQLYPNFMPLKGYGLPIFASVIPMAYNKVRVKNPPTSLADLSNPEFKGRVGIFNLESVGGVVNLIALAEANGGSIQNLDPGFAKLKEIRPNLATATSSTVDLYNLFQREEIWLATLWSGRVNALIEQGVPLEIAVPKEGLRTTLNFASLIKGTKVRGAALKFIEQIVSERNVARDRACCVFWADK